VKDDEFSVIFIIIV